MKMKCCYVKLYIVDPCVIMPRVVMLSVLMECRYAERQYAECCGAQTLSLDIIVRIKLAPLHSV